MLSSLWQITVIAFINEGIWVTRLKINMSFMLFLLFYRTLLSISNVYSLAGFLTDLWKIYLPTPTEKTVGYLSKSNQMERSGGSIKSMMIKQQRSLWWDFPEFLHRNANKWIGSTVHISELVFMPLHLKHNFKVTGYVKKKNHFLSYVYISS